MAAPGLTENSFKKLETELSSYAGIGQVQLASKADALDVSCPIGLGSIFEAHSSSLQG